LVAVVPVHGAVVKPRQHPPVGLLAVGDVFVVVIILDAPQGHARVLVRQAAARAGDEREPAGFAGQVVLGGDKRCGRVRAAAVARRPRGPPRRRGAPPPGPQGRGAPRRSPPRARPRRPSPRPAAAPPPGKPTAARRAGSRGRRGTGRPGPWRRPAPAGARPTG